MSSAYDTLILGTGGLVTYWPLNETAGNTATDNKDSLNATYGAGVVLNQTGVDGTPCPSFPGSLTTGAATTAAPPTGLPTGNNARTLELWINTSSAQTDPNSSGFCGIAGYGTASADQLFSLYCKTDNKTILIGDFGNNVLFVTSGFTNGVWHHIVAVYDGVTAHLYYDSALVQNFAVNYATTLGSNPFWIGRVLGTNGPFTGLIDKVAMYNVALTQAQILQHYQTGLTQTGLFIDGSSTATFGSATSGTVTLTTGQSADTIIVCVFSEDASGSAGRRTVTSVTATGLTFTHRATATGDGAFSSMAELWSARAAAPLSGVVITVNLSGNADGCVIVAAGVNGVFASQNYDSNASLPATANAAAASPSATPVSTTNKHDMLLAFMGAVNNTLADLGSAPSGYSTIIGASKGTGAFPVEAALAVQVVSATQSNTTVTWGTIVTPAHTVMIVDALTANPPPGAKGGGGGAFLHNPFGMPQGKRGKPPGRQRSPQPPQPPPQIRWIKQPCDPSQGNDCK